MVNLTRRRVLALIGLGALSIVVPTASKNVKAGPLTELDWIPVQDISIKSRKDNFNPNFEYGRAIECDGLKDNFAIRYLHRNAKRVLPRGTPYELRLSIPLFVERPEWGIKPRMCWYYSPHMLNKKLEGIRTDSSGEWLPRYSCWIRGRFYA